MSVKFLSLSYTHIDEGMDGEIAFDQVTAGLKTNIK